MIKIQSRGMEGNNGEFERVSRRKLRWDLWFMSWGKLNLEGVAPGALRLEGKNSGFKGIRGSAV